MNFYKKSNGVFRSHSDLVDLIATKVGWDFSLLLSNGNYFLVLLHLVILQYQSKVLSQRSFYSVDVVVPQKKNMYILSCSKLRLPIRFGCFIAGQSCCFVWIYLSRKLY